MRLRSVLADLPLYRAGQRPTAKPGIISYKLSSNESPIPPADVVLAAISAASANAYPDPANTELLVALSDYLGVPQAHLVAGCGSVALCQNAVQIAADAGDEVVYAWRSFEAYPIISGINGARPVPIPLLPDARHDVQAMVDAVTARTRVLFLCTPNNPTGPVVTADEVAWVLDNVGEDVLVVLDEAYVEFVTDAAAVDGLLVYPQHPNVISLRTFSKAFGLAGLRVGYAVAHVDVIDAMRKVLMPFGVSGAAQAAAVTSLSPVGLAHMRGSVGELVAERERVRAALLALGWSVPQAQTNFIWIPTAAAATLAADLDAVGLTVRPLPGEGVRISVGVPEANDRVIDFLQSAQALRSR